MPRNILLWLLYKTWRAGIILEAQFLTDDPWKVRQLFKPANKHLLWTRFVASAKFVSWTHFRCRQGRQHQIWFDFALPMTDYEWWLQLLRHFSNWKSFFIRAKLRPWRATSTSVLRTRPSSLPRRLWKKSSLPWVSTTRADYPSPKEAFLKTGKENVSLGHWNSTSQLDFLSLNLSGREGETVKCQ